MALRGKSPLVDIAPRGGAAGSFPEVNPLTPLDSGARGSSCPTSKSVVIPLERDSSE